VGLTVSPAPRDSVRAFPYNGSVVSAEPFAILLRSPQRLISPPKSVSSTLHNCPQTIYTGLETAQAALGSGS